MQTAQLLTRTLPGKIAAAKAPEKAELQKQLDEAQLRSGAERRPTRCGSAAWRSSWPTRTPDINDVNLIRYLLCYSAVQREATTTTRS